MIEGPGKTTLAEAPELPSPSQALGGAGVKKGGKKRTVWSPSWRRALDKRLGLDNLRCSPQKFDIKE